MSARHAQLKTRKTTIAQIVGRLFVGGMALGAAMPTLAANCTWSPATGNWGTAGNWSCAAVPGAADSATIALTKTVTIDTGQNIFNLSNAGSVNIDQFGLNLVGGGSTTNSGTINVGSAITANLGVSAGHNINNTGGVINVTNGSVINQFGSTITGGTINTTGTGKLEAFFSGSNILDGVTLNGNLDLATASGVERITNGLTLGGTININNGSVLAFEGTGGLSGTGTIVLGNTGGNNLIALDGTGTTTFAAGTTVRGENGSIGSQIFVGGTQTLVNNGTISADVAGGTINIMTAPVTNNGTLSALNGGTLVLSSNVTGNPGGQIVAGAGSTVLQNAVTLAGTINTSGSGRFAATASGANFLNGVTLNGNLDLATATGFNRVTAGGLVLNGTININNDSVLTFEGTGGLSGNGTIVLGNTGNNRIGLDGTGTTTFAAGTTVRGQNGTIGNAVFVGGTQTLVNNGTISADVSGGIITISTAPVTNNGTLSALNGGTLVLSSNVTGNPGGQIVAGAGSTVLQNAVTLAGTINTSGSGRFAATASGANFLNGVTLNGNLDLATATGYERVTAGGLVLNGTININNDSVLTFEGDGGLSGNGTIVLGNTGNNRIGLDGTGTTTFAAGTTVRGENGTIGPAVFVGGAQTLVNNGTINSDGGGTITIQGLTGGFTNNGLLRAQNGTLNVATVLTGIGGTLQVDSTGVVNLSNGSKVQGTLLMGATGAALNLGNINLIITGDYTNAAAGTGNSFNRRAGVTGAGGILATGTLQQVITGTGVTGGNTSNATLTLGNVRVGATTFNYQIGHAGPSGPTFRGAIQTNVNGANLNDARLSGTGVTPSNYNAGAPGGNSGNLGVTFTAGTAGVLAPLSGQVLNLRSNFENIADQKLNIVLGAGAAAYNAAAGNAAPNPVQVANQRTGGSNSAVLAISNTAAAGPFSEDLRATFGANGGAASNNGGSINQLIAGGSNNSAMSVGVNTATAGAKTGTVTLNYETLGTVNGVSNGLGVASVGNQVITVNGNVYQVAQGQLNTAPLNFGTVQVGQSVSQTLSISNTATGANGFVEDLNATFGASSGTGAGLIAGTGSLNGILAGQSSTGANGTMTVNVNTTSAGTVNGAIAVNFITAGAVNGVSNGLGQAGVGQASYGVAGVIQSTGNVIDQAAPLINNPTINLGNVRLGAISPTANVSVTNVASGNQQAALNASITGNAPITATGAFNLLAPGATDNTSLSVGMNTGTTGAINGTATIAFVSDASNVGNCAPNCQMTLASQNVTVSGAVYALANPLLNTPSVTLAARVGNASPSQVVSVTNASADAFREGLNASISTGAVGFTATGAVTNLAAQANSGNALSVALNTGTAGTFSGTATLALASNGSITNNADLALPNQTVTLSGKVYTAAQATVQSPVNFGIVHVGDVVTAQGVSVQNSAPVTALNDTLRASIGGATGPFTSNNGNVAGLTAGGAANTTALTVGLNTATAGVFNGTATIALTSQNPDMIDLALLSQNVALTGQVNKFANAVFDKVSGAGNLTRSGNIFTLDFGTVFQGAGNLNAIFDVDNLVNGGPADLLDGSLTVIDGNDFTTLLSGAFQNVAADGSSGNLLSFLFNTANLGLFTDQIDLDWFGHNASGYQDQNSLYTLLVRGNVVAANGNTVPEPSSLLLMAIALAGLGASRRRKAA